MEFYIIITILVLLNLYLIGELIKSSKFKKSANVVLSDVAKDGRTSYKNQRTASKLTGIPAGPRPKSGRPRKRK